MGNADMTPPSQGNFSLVKWVIFTFLGSVPLALNGKMPIFKSQRIFPIQIICFVTLEYLFQATAILIWKRKTKIGLLTAV